MRYVLAIQRDVGLSDSMLTVRDLSPENLSSIFWLVSTALSCFLATLAVCFLKWYWAGHYTSLRLSGLY